MDRRELDRAADKLGDLAIPDDRIRGLLGDVVDQARDAIVMAEELERERDLVGDLRGELVELREENENNAVRWRADVQVIASLAQQAEAAAAWMAEHGADERCGGPLFDLRRAIADAKGLVTP